MADVEITDRERELAASIASNAVEGAAWRAKVERELAIILRDYRVELQTPPEGVTATITTYSGVTFDLFRPRPEQVDLKDIAHALGMTCRYGGHCSRFYSVAEHSIHVSRLVGSEPGLQSLAMCGLLHDAAEAYVGDVVSPIKRHMTVFQVVEQRIMEAVLLRFGMSPYWPRWVSDLVHTADKVALRIEQGFLFDSIPMPDDVDTRDVIAELACWDPFNAEQAFLRRFEELTA